MFVMLYMFVTAGRTPVVLRVTHRGCGVCGGVDVVGRGVWTLQRVLDGVRRLFGVFGVWFVDAIPDKDGRCPPATAFHHDRTT